MLVIPALPDGFHAATAQNFWLLPALDAIVLVLLASPIIYFWAVRPFVLERGRNEELLRIQNTRFEEAQRVGNIGSWELDLIRDELKWTPEAYRIFEITPEEFRGTQDFFLNAIHPDDLEGVRAAYTQSLETRQPYISTHRIFAKGGRVKWLEERCSTEFDAKGNPVKSMGTVQDITERMAVETAKNQFISLISHELKTPLTSIKGSLDLITAGATGRVPDKAKNLIDIARRNGDRLMSLVNDLLDLEQLESGQMLFNMCQTDLTTLISEAVESCQGYADGYEVSIIAPAVGHPVYVHGDHGRLMQVMANLISNAVKFSNKGGKVVVSLVIDEPNVRVLVQDQGQGIPEKAKNTIFDRFTQADTSDTRQKTGSGLGLNITKSIVEKHGGTIGFESQIGVGTAFYFDLELETAGAEPALATA